MKKPQIKSEIVIKLCPNPQALSVSIATPRALEWVKAEGKNYTDSFDLDFMLSKKSVPCEALLLVNPCYDIKEVKEYLEKPQFGKQEPIKLAKV